MHEHGPYWDINTPVVTSRSRRTKLRYGTRKKRNAEKIKKLRKIAKQSKRKNRGGKK